MKDVYSVVANDFGITSHNCERLCRYACNEVVADREFAKRYPCFEQLTHRTYERVTVKELVDLLSGYVITKCNVRNRSIIKM